MFSVPKTLYLALSGEIFKKNKLNNWLFKCRIVSLFWHCISQAMKALYTCK